MRKRRNPIERRRARRPMMWPWVLAGFFGFILAPIAVITMMGDFDFTYNPDQGGWSFEGSYSSGSSGPDAPREDDGSGGLVFQIWTAATWLPPLAGGLLLWHGLDIKRGEFTHRGWIYRPGRAPDAGRNFSTFPVGVRPNQRVTNVAEGSVGTRVASCYTVWTSHKYRYSVEQLELPVVLPPVMILPEGAYDKVLTALGGEDLEVESADFNARWRVVAEDPAAAHAVLHPRVMERLLKADVDGMAISVDGGALLAWWPGLTSFEDATRHLDVLFDVADLIPASVFKKFGTPRDDLWGPATVSAPALTADQLRAQQILDQTYHP